MARGLHQLDERRQVAAVFKFTDLSVSVASDAFPSWQSFPDSNVPGIFYRSDRTAGTDMPRFVKEEKGVSRSYRNGLRRSASPLGVITSQCAKLNLSGHPGKHRRPELWLLTLRLA